MEFENSLFKDSEFKNLKFENSEFENSEFENSEFKNSEFENSEFENSEFENSEFENLEFENSEFENSELETSVIEIGLIFLNIIKYKQEAIAWLTSTRVYDGGYYYRSLYIENLVFIRKDFVYFNISSAVARYKFSVSPTRTDFMSNLQYVIQLYRKPIRNIGNLWKYVEAITNHV